MTWAKKMFANFMMDLIRQSHPSIAVKNVRRITRTANRFAVTFATPSQPHIKANGNIFKAVQIYGTNFAGMNVKAMPLQKKL